MSWYCAILRQRVGVGGLKIVSLPSDASSARASSVRAGMNKKKPVGGDGGDLFGNARLVARVSTMQTWQVSEAVVCGGICPYHGLRLLVRGRIACLYLRISTSISMAPATITSNSPTPEIIFHAGSIMHENQEDR